MTHPGEILAAIDEVVDDWENQPDAATWTADGSHQDAPPFTATTIHLGPIEVEWLTIANPDDDDRLREAFNSFSQHIHEHHQRLVKAFAPVAHAAMDAVRRAHTRMHHDWVLCPCLPSEPDPKAWTVFTRGPQHQPRTRYRAGPDPRRASVHWPPPRARRRP